MPSCPISFDDSTICLTSPTICSRSLRRNFLNLAIVFLSSLSSPLFGSTCALTWDFTWGLACDLARDLNLNFIFPLTNTSSFLEIHSGGVDPKPFKTVDYTHRFQKY